MNLANIYSIKTYEQIGEKEVNLLDKIVNAELKYFHDYDCLPKKINFKSVSFIHKEKCPTIKDVVYEAQTNVDLFFSGHPNKPVLKSIFISEYLFNNKEMFANLITSKFDLDYLKEISSKIARKKLTINTILKQYYEKELVNNPKIDSSLTKNKLLLKQRQIELEISKELLEDKKIQELIKLIYQYYHISDFSIIMNAINFNITHNNYLFNSHKKTL